MRRALTKEVGVSGTGAAVLSHLMAPESRAKGAKIKIGQVGVCHAHAGARMAALRNLPHEFEVVGVVDDSQSTAARYPAVNWKPYEGIPRLSEEALFQVPGLQAVMVEASNAELVSTALRCVDHGLAIAMDKPGGEDLPLFAQLLDGCRQRRLPFQMAYMLRNNPAIQFCQEAVRKGWLGDVFEIHAGMGHDYGGDAYQQYLAAYPGGIMYLLGCHHIDWVVSLLGRPDQVVSLLGSTAGAAHGAKNNSLALLQYPHSLVTIHACDQETGGSQWRRVKICGSQGALDFCPLERFDGQALQLELRLKEGNASYERGRHTIDLGVQTNRYEDQLREFAAIVRGERENPYSYDHDHLVHEVHLAASGYISSFPHHGGKK